jgi:hypothetical protein
MAEACVDPLQREHARVADSASPRHLDRERRGVDRDHLVAAALQLERDAPGARADVERPPTDPAESPPLRLGPPASLLEVRARPAADRDQAVVPLQDLQPWTPLELVEQQPTERVLVRLHPGILPGTAGPEAV